MSSPGHEGNNVYNTLHNQWGPETDAFPRAKADGHDTNVYYTVSHWLPCSSSLGPSWASDSRFVELWFAAFQTTTLIRSFLWFAPSHPISCFPDDDSSSRFLSPNIHSPLYFQWSIAQFLDPCTRCEGIPAVWYSAIFRVNYSIISFLYCSSVSRSWLNILIRHRGRNDRCGWGIRNIRYIRNIRIIRKGQKRGH